MLESDMMTTDYLYVFSDLHGKLCSVKIVREPNKLS